MTLYENKGTYQTEEGMFQMAIQQASKELGGIVSPNNMDVFQKFAWDEYKKIKNLRILRRRLRLMRLSAAAGQHKNRGQD